MTYKARENFFRRQRAEGKGWQKLTEKQVWAIRARLAKGDTQKAIAEEHIPRIAPSTVSAIATGGRWGMLQSGGSV